MNKIIQIEKLNSIRNEMTHIWGSVFILGGGAVTLILGELNHTKITLASIGFILSLLFFNTYLMRRNELRGLIKDLEEE